VDVKRRLAKLERQRRKGPVSFEIVDTWGCTTEAEAEARIAAKRADLAAEGRGDAVLLVLTWGDGKPAPEE